MRPEKTTISRQIASALSPSAMFVSVQYSVAWITRPWSALIYGRGVSGRRGGRWGGRAYDEGLVEGEHDDELDGEELGERAPAFQLVFR